MANGSCFFSCSTNTTLVQYVRVRCFMIHIPSFTPEEKKNSCGLDLKLATSLTMNDSYRFHPYSSSFPSVPMFIHIMILYASSLFYHSNRYLEMDYRFCSKTITKGF